MSVYCILLVQRTCSACIPTKTCMGLSKWQLSEMVRDCYSNLHHPLRGKRGGIGTKIKSDHIGEGEGGLLEKMTFRKKEQENLAY